MLKCGYHQLKAPLLQPHAHLEPSESMLDMFVMMGPTVECQEIMPNAKLQCGLVMFIPSILKLFARKVGIGRDAETTFVRAVAGKPKRGPKRARVLRKESLAGLPTTPANLFSVVR